ncbi:hypothetical protein HHI36_006970 [Cryptolaemus montrouzieri]|uniref:Uncharacterized protein n=1 Tax=Cryptolaemus montrouzieri TaxID=559131 RepID=A0ABD2MP23_9CUCU
MLQKNTKPTVKTRKINVESLRDPTIEKLYKNRLNGKIEENPITEEDDVKRNWEKIKNNILTAAYEALGTRISNNSKKNTNRTSWFRMEVAEKCREKKHAYLTYRTLRTPESYNEYQKSETRPQR